MAWDVRKQDGVDSGYQTVKIYSLITRVPWGHEEIRLKIKYAITVGLAAVGG